jgi:hypothetical protein
MNSLVYDTVKITNNYPKGWVSLLKTKKPRKIGAFY